MLSMAFYIGVGIDNIWHYRNGNGKMRILYDMAPNIEHYRNVNLKR